MAWATEMKSLVSDIKTSTKDRLQFVKDNQTDTHDLLARFDKELKEMAVAVEDVLEESRNLIKRFAGESKERTADVKELLSRFDKEMSEMAKDLKDLLTKSEQTRMADFKVTMKNIQSRINVIQKDVADLLSEYTEERKEARANWGALRKQERAIAAGEEAEEPKKTAKKAKKHKAK